jgi:DNA-directed RNA polymerase subunit M/transcription elongation factor TFIIS
MNLVLPEDSAVVATFHKLSNAQAFGEYLERQGVEMKVQDERRLQRYWFLARPSAGIHVLVSKEQLTVAEERLKAWEAKVTPGSRAIHCPECGSSRIQYPQMTRRFLLPTIVAQIGVGLGIITQSFYCEDCHHTWKKDSRKVSQRKTAPSARDGRCERLHVRRPRSAVLPTKHTKSRESMVGPFRLL